MSTIKRNFMGGRWKNMKTGRRRNKNPDLPVDTSTGIDHYGVVSKRLGDNQLSVKLDTGTEIRAIIPGKFRRRVWFKPGDYVQVQSTGDNYYDVIQKIVNETEQAKAQTAIGKKENTDDDTFMPDYEEESESNSDDETDSDSDGVDAFGNKVKKEEEVKLNKNTVDVDKYKRKQKEKERDVSRRNTTRDYDIKPESIVENLSELTSESTSESDAEFE
jgi:initiation factor 1A